MKVPAGGVRNSSRQLRVVLSGCSLQREHVNREQEVFRWRSIVWYKDWKHAVGNL